MTQWSHSVNCESQKRRPAPSWESPEARKRLHVFTYFYFISNTWNWQFQISPEQITRHFCDIWSQGGQS